MRYLRPAAALLQPSELAVGHVLVLDEKERIQAWLQPEDCPPGAEVEEYPDERWVAAPRLLHAHLESYDAPSANWPRTTFAAWAEALLAWRLTVEDRLSVREAVQASARELADLGCGFVLASASEPGAQQAQDAGALAVESWPELFEPDPAQARSTWARFCQESPDVRGLALHAPFSVSPELARLALEWAQESGRYVSIHLGEHEDERALLRDHAGPLADLLRARGRELPSRRWDSPVAWLEDVAPGPRPRVLAVHAGALSETELQALQAKQIQVVFCPGTHRYFERPQPRFEAAGLPAPLLGCDSRASNAELNPWAELREAASLLPKYTGQEWWAALTTRAAAALGDDASEGSLLPGRKARIARLPDPGLREPASLCDSLASAEGSLPLASTGIPAPSHVHRG